MDTATGSQREVNILVTPPCMADMYYRTRHKHLRCFPQCSGGIHNERSFCGDSLVVTVSPKVVGDAKFKPMDMTLYGEFHKMTREALLNLGQRMDQSTIPDRIVRATFVLKTGTGSRFAFNPPRKWEYRTKIRKGDLHVFTISCIIGGRVVGECTTNPFMIVPILKLGAKEKDDDSESDTGDAAAAEAVPPSAGEKATASLYPKEPTSPKEMMSVRHASPTSQVFAPSSTPPTLPNPRSHNKTAQMHGTEVAQQQTLKRPLFNSASLGRSLSHSDDFLPSPSSSSGKGPSGSNIVRNASFEMPSEAPAMLGGPPGGFDLQDQALSLHSPMIMAPHSNIQQQQQLSQLPTSLYPGASLYQHAQIVPVSHGLSPVPPQIAFLQHGLPASPLPPQAVPQQSQQTGFAQAHAMMFPAPTAVMLGSGSSASTFHHPVTGQYHLLPVASGNMIGDGIQLHHPFPTAGATLQPQQVSGDLPYATMASIQQQQQLQQQYYQQYAMPQQQMAAYPLQQQQQYLQAPQQQQQPARAFSSTRDTGGNATSYGGGVGWDSKRFQG